MKYNEVFPPSQKKPKTQIDTLSRRQLIGNLVNIQFDNSTVLAVGAVLQACLVLLPLPTRYALAPAILYLLSKVLQTALISLGFLPNPYLKGSLAYRFTALVPDRDGNFPAEGKAPTSEKVAVLILATKCNHPMGWLGAPETKAFLQLFERMKRDFETMSQSESGFLGQSQATMPTSNGVTELLQISYWRSAAHILKYAESPAHQAAMKWWNDAGGYEADGGKVRHIGIMHEIYESGPGKWESVYLGYQPTLLSATSFVKKGEKQDDGTVPEEWVSPVLEARRGKLARSRGRMGFDWRAELDEKV